jgi:hypothetical protein
LHATQVTELNCLTPPVSGTICFFVVYRFLHSFVGLFACTNLQILSIQLKFCSASFFYPDWDDSPSSSSSSSPPTNSLDDSDIAEIWGVVDSAEKLGNFEMDEILTNAVENSEVNETTREIIVNHLEKVAKVAVSELSPVDNANETDDDWKGDKEIDGEVEKRG